MLTSGGITHIMHKHKLRLFVAGIILITITVTVYATLLYRQGAESNYTPPPQPTVSPRKKAGSDLHNLARAVEAYFIKNMSYPQRLELLTPEFIERVDSDPLSGKPYLYTLDTTKGLGRYRISVPDAKLYNAKEFYLEDGKLVQNQL
jgi:hypothetical protein